MGTKHEFDFDFTKLKKVPIEQVTPNEWNPKDKDTKEYKQKKFYFSIIKKPIN